MLKKIVLITVASSDFGADCLPQNPWVANRR